MKSLFLKRIPSSIWALGLVSMFTDISSELIHSLLPIFMVTVLGASMISVGLIEGIAESAALIAKIFSGILSDIIGRRKLLAVIGYGISACSKPLFPLANTITTVFFARFCDRIGKGIRDAPRNALIGELSPAKIRGASFGLRQSLDTLGAFIGPLLAILLMFLFSDNIRRVLWIAVIPGFISVIILVYFVKEPKRKKRKSYRIYFSKIQHFGIDYWGLVAIGAVFALARFSQAFLVLKAQSNGLPMVFIPLVMVAMNVLYALSGYPVGVISDYVNRKSVLLIGIGFLIVGDIILGFSDALWSVFLGAGFWGLHMGFTEGVLEAMIADTTDSRMRGTAYSIYNFISGIAILCASLVAGILWDKRGPSLTFFAGALFSILAFIGLMSMYKKDKKLF